jgi:hypothetical protein
MSSLFACFKIFCGNSYETSTHNDLDLVDEKTDTNNNDNDTNLKEDLE